MQAPRLFRQLVTRTRPTNCQRQYANDIFPKQTMDDLPSPKGSWQTNYDQNQKKYNRDLILGVLFTGITLGYGQYMGFHEFYGGVPETPATIESYERDPNY